VKTSIGSIDKELDGLDRRKWSQRLKGKLDRCANRAGLKKLKKASIVSHFKVMDEDNKESVLELYHFYDKVIPKAIKQMTHKQNVSEQPKMSVKL